MSAVMAGNDKTEMPRKPPKTAAEAGREARLKAALKANMARRKAQAKARYAGDDRNGAGDNENKSE